MNARLLRSVKDGSVLLRAAWGRHGLGHRAPVAIGDGQVDVALSLWPDLIERIVRLQPRKRRQP